MPNQAAFAENARERQEAPPLPTGLVPCPACGHPSINWLVTGMTCSQCGHHVPRAASTVKSAR